MTIKFPLTVSRHRTKEKFLVAIDRYGFERLADSLGLFNPDFLNSLNRAEADVDAGRIKKLHQLSDLRKKR